MNKFYYIKFIKIIFLYINISMKQRFFPDILASISYVIFSALLFVYNESGVKTVVVAVGITLCLCATALFLSHNKEPFLRMVACIIFALGAAVIIFSRFFVAVSLFLCGAGLLCFGLFEQNHSPSPISLLDIFVGALLFLSAFFLRRIFLFILALCLILNASIRILYLLGVIEE